MCTLIFFILFLPARPALAAVRARDRVLSAAKNGPFRANRILYILSYRIYYGLPTHARRGADKVTSTDDDQTRPARAISKNWFRVRNRYNNMFTNNYNIPARSS